MWIYEKKLQYPMKVSGKDVRMARNILTQYGGPNGESAASMQYLNQRYSMPYKEGKAVLTDIGTEELAHMEMIATLYEMLLCGATKDDFIKAGYDGRYIERKCNPHFLNTDGDTFNLGKETVTTGNPEVDMYANMAAEKRAETTYENLIQMTDDPLLKDSLRFLREREVVHFQRFGEVLRLIQEKYKFAHEKYK